METLEITEPKMDVVKLSITDTEIAQMKSDFMPLTVNGIEDKAGLKKVYESRQVVKRYRVDVVKQADALKEKAIAWQKKVNTEKNRIVGELEAIEAHLQSEEDKIAEEKERLRKEEEARENARVQNRIDQLAAYGFAIDYTTIKTIDDATFETVLNNAKAEHAKELAAKAEADRLAKEEQDRLKAEREELERLRQQQAKAQAIIDAENEKIRKEQKRIEEEKQASELRKQKEIEDKRREQELEDARIEAAEQARLKAIKDAEKALADKMEAERLERIEAERQATLRPDKEKLQSFSDNLSEMKLPVVAQESAQLIVNEIQLMINKMQAHILKKIKDL